MSPSPRKLFDQVSEAMMRGMDTSQRTLDRMEAEAAEAMRDIRTEVEVEMTETLKPGVTKFLIEISAVRLSNIVFESLHRLLDEELSKREPEGDAVDDAIMLLQIKKAIAERADELVVRLSYERPQCTAERPHTLLRTPHVDWCEECQGPCRKRPRHGETGA